MKKEYVIPAVCLLCACQMTVAKAEGFSLTQWSARGLSLAGGMVERADDPSAIAYNAAGITRLPGTHVMVGYAAVTPESTFDLYEKDGSFSSTTTGAHILSAPYAYLTHQLNEHLWLGLGLFSRFGLDNEFPDNWAGRYDLTDIKFQTFSFVPTLAVKVNDALSLSAGVEIMHASLTMGKQIQCFQLSSAGSKKAEDIKMTLDGSHWGVGVHLGVHVRMTDKLSLGLAYKSPVTLRIDGSADFSRNDENLLAEMDQVPHAIDTGVHGRVRLPDSLAVGLTYYPLDNLSIELGTVFTRWSTYDSLNIRFDSDFESSSAKKWRNGWNFNASVEYEPMDWLALRAGVWHETSVTNEAHADFMVPGHGRTGVSLGTGLRWENWNVDIGYAHLWMRGQDYSSFESSDLDSGKSHDLSANIYSVSIGYAF